MGKAGFKVTTWANGYGLWHAKVEVPNMAAMGPQVQRAARRAIVAAIQERQGAPVGNVGVRFVAIENGNQVHYEEFVSSDGYWQ